jgi:uncharacterized protein (DUF4415 family)
VFALQKRVVLARDFGQWEPGLGGKPLHRLGKADPLGQHWKKVDKLTDAEIEAAMARDPDWADFNDADWSEAVLVMPPKKKAISIRVDEDVLDYFKQQGAGYQRRMNAVLRSYMQQTRKSKKHA